MSHGRSQGRYICQVTLGFNRCSLLGNHESILSDGHWSSGISDLFKPVVCAIIAMFRPPSAIDLARLLEKLLDNAVGTMDPLSSVLDSIHRSSDKQNANVQLIHQSFRDSLFDQNRPTD